MGFQIGWGQDPSGKIKYEINGVYELPRFSLGNISTDPMGSYVYSPGSFESNINIGAEIGVSYQLRKRHLLAGRLGAFLITNSASRLFLDPPLEITGGTPISSLPIMHTNKSFRLELSHRYLLYDDDMIQFSLNSGLGIRYWSWNQTSEITYYDLLVDPNPIPIGEYTSSSIRPFHPDFNLGFAVVLKEFFKNIDVSLSYSYLWAPLDAYSVDSLTFRDGSGEENHFQFDNNVNFTQFRLGFIFNLGDNNGADVKG